MSPRGLRGIPAALILGMAGALVADAGPDAPAAARRSQGAPRSRGRIRWVEVKHRDVYHLGTNFWPEMLPVLVRRAEKARG